MALKIARKILFREGKYYLPEDVKEISHRLKMISSRKSGVDTYYLFRDSLDKTYWISGPGKFFFLGKKTIEKSSSPFIKEVVSMMSHWSEKVLLDLLTRSNVTLYDIEDESDKI